MQILSNEILSWFYLEIDQILCIEENVAIETQ